MAQMIPPVIPASNSSSAEEQLFDKIKGTLSNDWTVLHSLVLSEHRTKPWAELDFVLVGPEGIFGLEVKGGRVARHDGEWHFTNRQNQTTSKKEGPFQQVRTAQAALRTHLLQRFPHLSDVAFGNGVAFPHIEWNEWGPDMPPEIVYDARDHSQSFSGYKRQLTSYWYKKIEEIRGREPRNLSERERREVIDALRGDFDLRPSLKTTLGITANELIRLTDEQFAVLQNLQDNPRVWIRGGAGTGKTLLAIEETRRLVEEGKRVFFCCYNKRLGAHLQKTSNSLGALAQNVTVGHFDGFVTSTVRRANLQHKLPKAEAKDLFDVFYPELCLEALDQEGLWGSYDAVIVDEAQDLLGVRQVDVFDALLKGGLSQGQWRLFYDPFQNIFARHTPEGINVIEKHNPARFRLSVNCRNTKPIAVTTGMLCGQAVEDAPTNGPEVVWLWHQGSTQDEAKSVVSQVSSWLSDHVAPEDIVILSPRRRENSCLRNVSRCGNFALLNDDDSSSQRHIRFATIQSFKGLEAKVVVLCDLHDLTNQQTQSAVYVGCTRAQTLLAVALGEMDKSVLVQNTIHQAQSVI